MPDTKRVFIVKITGDSSLELLDMKEVRDAIVDQIGPLDADSDFCAYGVEVFEL